MNRHWNVLFLFCFLPKTTVAGSQDNSSFRCDLPLGLEYGNIPDSAITSSFGYGASKARFDSNGAWCFMSSQIQRGQVVTLTIDLGTQSFVTGVKTQGPPANLKNMQYNYHIGFYIENSTDSSGSNWDTCCEGKKLLFYSEDPFDGSDEVNFHTPGMLILARRIRLRFETDVRWAGEDEKCFRVEILGCSQEIIPKTNLKIQPLLSGWVEVTWARPQILIPNDTVTEPYYIPIDNYKANLTWIENFSEIHKHVNSSMITTEVPRIMVPGPIWGAIYSLALICPHQGIELPCENASITATVEGCDPFVSQCTAQNEVVFRKPQQIKSWVIRPSTINSIDFKRYSQLYSSNNSSNSILLNNSPSSSSNSSSNDTSTNPPRNFSTSAPSRSTLPSSANSGNLSTNSQNNFSNSSNNISSNSSNSLSKNSSDTSPVSDVFVSWTSEGSGWVTTSTRIRILDQNNKEIINKIIHEEGHYILLSNLDGPVFKLILTPQVNTLQYTPSFIYKLFVIPWSSLDETRSRDGFGAFVTDVTLEATIHWEGKMLVTWSPALVREGDLLTVELDDNSTQLQINSETEFTGQANFYNVTMRETGDSTSLEARSISASRILRTEFPLLKLEKYYEINISCDYGGIIVQCGSASKFTALPVRLTVLRSAILVYVERLGGEGWYRQEESCGKGNGTLATFGTRDEEFLLRPHLLKNPKITFKTFWIGLNMCPDNKGSLWSDGSQWIYNLLPHVDAGLSSGTCCIKAEQTKQYKFTWLGEACSALLPAICEYKPRGLVGYVTDLTRGNSTQTTVSYKWHYHEKYWTPSTILATLCPTMDLKTFQPLNSSSCSTTNISLNNQEYESGGLSVFTEFKVSVCAALSPLNYQGSNQTVFVRTLPHEPVFLNIRGTGHLNVMWAQKVAEFGENDRVSAVVYEGPLLSEKTRTLVPAKNLTIAKLRIGEQYRISLKETYGLMREEVRDFAAYPPCDCKDCQHKTKCLFPSDKQVPYSMTITQCHSEDSTLAVSFTRDRLLLLLRQAERVHDDLWVSSSSLKGNASYSAVVPSTVIRDLVINGTARPYFTSTTTAPVVTNFGECLLVSRSQKAVIVATDCRESHYAACEQKAPLSPIFPPPSEIKTKVGGTWFTLNWDTSISGWMANYTVYYQRTSEKRYKRALKNQQFFDPPVLIDGLDKNTAYSIELMADLGNGFLYTTDEFERITSDSNTRSNLDIEGTASLSKDGSQTWMTAGWSPSPEFFLANLVCGTSMITACICTMLLFFATGMFYQDCIAQLGFLFSLLISYLLLLVAHPHYVVSNENGCVALSALLHFFFMCGFFFLALEALTMSHLLVERIKSPFENSNWALVVVAIFGPMVYVGISVSIIQMGYPYTTAHNCWVNTSGHVIYVEAVPNAMALLLTIFLILSTTSSNEDTRPILKDTEIRGRQSDCYKLRWVILLISLEYAVTWSSGVAAYSTHTPGAHGVFNTFTLILAITIVVARTWLDDTFRSKIKRLCCGTELTYKRSAIRSISARTRIHPSIKDTSRSSSGFSSGTTRASHGTYPSYNLRNSAPPPVEKNNSEVLVKRTYKFDKE